METLIPLSNNNNNNNNNADNNEGQCSNCYNDNNIIFDLLIIYW